MNLTSLRQQTTRLTSKCIAPQSARAALAVTISKEECANSRN